MRVLEGRFWLMIVCEGAELDVQRKPSADSGSFRPQTAVVGTIELHRPATMSSFLTAVSVFLKSMLRLWQQDQIRVPPSEGTLLRLQPGNRVIIREHVFLVTRHQLKRSSVLLILRYGLKEWNSSLSTSDCCDHPEYDLVVSVDLSSLRIRDLQLESLNDLQHGTRLSVTCLHPDEVLGLTSQKLHL